MKKTESSQGEAESCRWTVWLLIMALSLSMLGGYYLGSYVNQVPEVAVVIDREIAVEATTPSDHLLSSRIRFALLENQSLPPTLSMHIATTDGIVTLKGIVPSSDQKERIGRIIRNMNGVAQVVNHLQVKSSSANKK
jgi:hypothetical protein